jgi:uncharacterized protein YecE (DUF72 family)
VTSDFIYCRLHGSEVLYASGYDDKALDEWAERITAWARGGEPKDAEKASSKPAPKRAGRDVFVYFDNDVKVRAPRDAQALIARLRKRLGDAVVLPSGIAPEIRVKVSAAPGPHAPGKTAKNREKRANPWR